MYDQFMLGGSKCLGSEQEDQGYLCCFIAHTDQKLLLVRLKLAEYSCVDANEHPGGVPSRGVWMCSHVSSTCLMEHTYTPDTDPTGIQAIHEHRNTHGCDA